MQPVSLTLSSPHPLPINPVPSSLTSSAEPLLPGSETVRVLQIGGKHKRKIADLMLQPAALAKRLQTEPASLSSSSVSGFSSSSISSSSAPCAQTAPEQPEQSPAERLAELLSRSTALDPEQTGDAIRELVIAMGGPELGIDHRNALLMKILDTHATSSAVQMGIMIHALGCALSGTAMRDECCNGLIDRLLAARKPFTSQQMGKMIQGLGVALGGQAMTEANRDKLIYRINLNGTIGPCDDMQFPLMIRGLAMALGGRAISAENARGLIRGFAQPNPSWICVDKLKSRGPVLTERAGASERYSYSNFNFDRLIEIHSALAFGLGGSAMTGLSRDRLLAQILAVVKEKFISARYARKIIHSFGVILGGPVMPAEHRDALIAVILDSRTHGCSLMKITYMIWGLGLALGGRTMTADHRDALMVGIMGARHQFELRQVVRCLCKSLGGPAMTAANREAMMRHIINAPAMLTEEQIGYITVAFSDSLGGTSMVPEHREALMTQLLAAGAVCHPMKLSMIVCGLAAGLGGENITATNRDALLARLFNAHATLSGTQMGYIVEGLAYAVGHEARDDRHRDAMLMQIIDARTSCGPLKLAMMIQKFSSALGIFRIMSADHPNSVLRQILATHAVCNAQELGAMMFGLCEALGGPAMIAAHRDSVLNQILGAHQTLSADQMEWCFGSLLRSMTKSMNQTLTAENREALVTRVVGSYVNGKPLHLAKMISELWWVAKVDDLMTAIRQAGASPLRTGMMIAAVFASHASISQSQWQMVRDRVFVTGDLALPGKPYWDAGFHAARGDISGIVLAAELTAQEKISFINCSFNILRSLTRTALHRHLGNLLLLDLPLTFKAETLSTLLRHGPFDPQAFASVRQWLIGTLGEVSDISLVSSKQELTVTGQSSGFADWYISISALYQDFSKRMPLELIKKEQSLITTHIMLPAEVKKKILDILSQRQRELEQQLEQQLEKDLLALGPTSASGPLS